MIGATLAIALALAGPTAPAPAAALPKHGVLVPGKSLAGVRLGQTAAAVRARWGRGYRLCTVCTLPTWLFSYRTGNPVGAAVSFRKGRAAVIFTLGSPVGWNTPQGVVVGGDVQSVKDVYAPRRLTWSGCIGYAALSMRSPGVVTSIYANGDVVYGFALSRPGESVCQ